VDFEALFRERFVLLVGFLITAGARQPDVENAAVSRPSAPRSTGASRA
jgi:hypothetical protein